MTQVTRLNNLFLDTPRRALVEAESYSGLGWFQENNEDGNRPILV
jgi:hypothetical protein